MGGCFLLLQLKGEMVVALVQHAFGWASVTIVTEKTNQIFLALLPDSFFVFQYLELFRSWSGKTFFLSFSFLLCEKYRERRSLAPIAGETRTHSMPQGGLSSKGTSGKASLLGIKKTKKNIDKKKQGSAILIIVIAWHTNLQVLTKPPLTGDPREEGEACKAEGEERPVQGPAGSSHSTSFNLLAVVNTCRVASSNWASRSTVTSRTSSRRRQSRMEPS